MSGHGTDSQQAHREDSLTTEQRPSLTTVYSIVAIASFYSGAYAYLGEPAPPVVEVFIGVVPFLAVCMWFRRYLVEAGRSLPYDYGFFLYLGWPLLIPIESLRLHGARGWRLIGRLFALVVAPDVLAEVVKLLREL